MGGMGVAVGMAICVIATTVQAAETAVPSTSAGAIVGVPCGPQAVRNMASTAKTGIIFLNIVVLSIFIVR